MLCFTVTYAQRDSVTTDIFDLSLEELMNIEVTTASKFSQKASEAPATVYVVTQQQINERNYSSLKELLMDIPQIEIQNKSYAEFSDIYSINGIAGNEKFLVLMDGIRITSNTGTGHTIDESYSLANVKQVEVILGPASSLYGADAFTGIINIITFKGYENKGFSFSSSYGSFNTTDNVLVFGAGNKDISFSLSAKYYHSDEAFIPEYYPQDFAWYNHYKETGEMLMFGDTVKPAIGFKQWATLNDAYSVHAKLNYKKIEIGYSGQFESHSSVYGYEPSATIYFDEAVYANHVQNLYAFHSFESKSQKFFLNSTVSAQDFKVYPNSLFINQFSNYSNGYKYERNKTIKIEEQFSYNIEKYLVIIGGASYEYINAIPKTSDLPLQYNENLSFDSQNIYYPGTNFTDINGNDLTIIQDIFNVNYYNIGSYLQFQTQFSKKL